MTDTEIHLGTSAAKQSVSDCFAMVKLTPDGFKYDKAVTKPNTDVYDCDAKNVGSVQTYQS